MFAHYIMIDGDFFFIHASLFSAELDRKLLGLINILANSLIHVLAST